MSAPTSASGSDPAPPDDAAFAHHVSGARVAVHYVVLAALVAAALIVSVSLGQNKHAQPNIAGGYDVSAGTACLGAKLNIVQSGRYVNLSNPQSTLSGDLLFKNGVLTGTAHCVNGPVAAVPRGARQRRARRHRRCRPGRRGTEDAIRLRRGRPSRSPPPRSAAPMRSPRRRPASADR